MFSAHFFDFVPTIVRYSNDKMNSDAMCKFFVNSCFSLIF